VLDVGPDIRLVDIDVSLDELVPVVAPPELVALCTVVAAELVALCTVVDPACDEVAVVVRDVAPVRPAEPVERVDPVVAVADLPGTVTS
jgi:hypothetical protein